MKSKVIWTMFIAIFAVSMVLTSCRKKAQMGAGGGEPQYGGTITRAVASFGGGFDPYNWQNAQNSIWFEPLWLPDYTLDRSTNVFAHMWLPAEYWAGNLAEKWEWSDPKTLTVYLRKGVLWQNKPPVNGREFTTDDIIYHFDRMMGTGSGFTKPNPFYAGRFEPCQKVTAKDKYTIVFHFKQANNFINSNSIIGEPILQFFEAREVYAMGKPVIQKAGGGGPPGPPGPKGPPGPSGLNTALNDWKNQIGTGAFMLTDYVANSTMSLNKNPDYWAYDERNPDNRLPYVDTFKIVLISDTATQLAALRTGKVDIAHDIDWKQAKSLEKSNPELLKGTYAAPGMLLQLRCDRKPFTDIRVRKALQMAIDLPKIAETYYGGTVSPIPVGLINPDYKGFADPYDDWPQALKDEYSYNPDKAKQLLAEAGYPKGFNTNVIATAAGPGADLELLQILKSYFMDIGVNMDIKALADFPSMMNMIMAKKHDQMVSMGLSDDTPPQMGMRFYISKEPSNGLCQNDPKFDAMVDDVVHAGELEKTQSLASEVNMYWLQQHWVVTTFPLQKYVLWQPYIKGYSGEKADSWSFVSLIPRMWVDKDLKESMGR